MLDSNKSPLFTIITAVHNAEAHIENYIRSVVDQNIDHTTYELILIDDCSTDRSYEICRKWANSVPNVVKVHRLENHQGRATTRNIGVVLAEGKWVTFCNADDLLEWDYLVEIERVIRENPECEMFSGSYRTYNTSNGDLSLNHPLSFRYENDNWVTDVNENSDCIHTHASTTFFKTALVKSHEILFAHNATRATEDLLFVNQYTLRTGNPLRCFVGKAYYFKRQTTQTPVAMHRSETSKIDAYSDQIEFGLLPLLKEANAKHTHLYHYIQNTLIFHIYECLKSINDEQSQLLQVSKRESERYHQLMTELMAEIPLERIQNYNTTTIPENFRIIMSQFKNEGWKGKRTIQMIGINHERNIIKFHYLTKSKGDDGVTINGQAATVVNRTDTPVRLFGKIMGFEREEWIEIRKDYLEAFKRRSFSHGNVSLTLKAGDKIIPTPISSRNLYKVTA